MQFEIPSPWPCNEHSHRCGQTPSLGHRCEAFYDTWSALRNAPPYPKWYDCVLEQCNPNVSSLGRAYARPGNCIHDGKLLFEEEINKENFRYLAVSYTWETAPEMIQWNGREVTEQALEIYKDLSKHTSLPLWIDAICIPQSKDKEEIKMKEIGKMADIYRGAQGVLCLIPDMLPGTSQFVSQAIKVMHSDHYRKLEEAGDVLGCYIFATAGENIYLQTLYSSRWWGRGWTFQEAVLNPKTYLIGPTEETIPIQDTWSLASIIQRRSTTTTGLTALSRPTSFWDSVMTMVSASKNKLSLGDAIGCVWRRDVGRKHDLVYSMLGVCQLRRIIPNYDIPFDDVLISLFQHASEDLDFSWLRWTFTIDHLNTSDGLCMVPLPQDILSQSTVSNVSKWHPVALKSLPAPRDGGGKGVFIPYQSLGVVRSQSSPQNLFEIIDELKKRGHGSREIWDMVFGLHIGFMADIEEAIGHGDGWADLILDQTLRILDGSMELHPTHSDMPSTLPFTKGISFMNYSIMAAQTWKDRLLVIMNCQGGTAVVPEHVSETGKSRLHRLPIELGKRRSLVAVVYDCSRYHINAVGVLAAQEHTGNGKWQAAKFGDRSFPNLS
ncbi:heterokaryon incompatibility protein-domain-containing protein [Crucibulum laeve]|uniref:Heterokaryon incompatibility protein-domain-containing protein n=1 Tax=Crucibulum laeve TaxID=68775 RepID=A0A5C3LV41_9AGAR|nr:heterokaryon incompatibility protein-domain-containing protein [Crucibulum laeve]